MSFLNTTAFVMIMSAGMLMDLRTNRIPNVVIGAGLLTALVLQAASGFAGVSEAVLGAGLAFLFAFPLFAIGALGGGDAKLLMVVGAFMGPGGLLYAAMVSSLVGGVVALAVAVRCGVILPVLLGCKDLIVYGVTFGRRGGRPKLGSPGAITIPYGAAIALGSIATWFLLPRAV